MRTFFTKKLIKYIIGILTVAAFFVAYFIIEHKTLYHFDTIDSGKMYRSGTLSNLGLKWVYKISEFRTIVNLRSAAENKLPWHEHERRFCEERGITMADIPMEADTPPAPEQIKQFLELVGKKENLPAIIHCHQGVVRTGMMAAVYEIAVKEKDNKEVLKDLNTFGHDFNKDDKREVVNFILNYKPSN